MKLANILTRVETKPATQDDFRGIPLAVAVGAAIAYFWDPTLGRRRRARVQERGAHFARVAEDFTHKAAIDFRNRAKGVSASVKRKLRKQQVPDSVLESRVRSALGRVVSHPSALVVVAFNSEVTLSGPILEQEAALALRRASRVPGVRKVVDKLERHKTAAHIPALQGNTQRRDRPELLQERWSPATRLLVGMGAVALALPLPGLKFLPSFSARGLGGVLLLRSVTNLPLKRLIGIGAGARAIDLRKDIHIAAPPAEVFRFVRDIENIPRFMTHIRSVIIIDERRSRWHALGPLGVPVEWEAELTEFEPDRRLAWQSLSDSTVQSSGVLRLDPENSGTRLEIHMSYNPPGGAIGHALAWVSRKDPKRALDDDLARLKSLLETGRTTAHGQTVTRDDLDANATKPLTT